MPTAYSTCDGRAPQTLAPPPMTALALRRVETERYDDRADAYYPLGLLCASFSVPRRRSAVPFQCEALARVRPACVAYLHRLRRLTTPTGLRLRLRWRRWRHNIIQIIFFLTLRRRRRYTVLYTAVAAILITHSQVSPNASTIFCAFSII